MKYDFLHQEPGPVTLQIALKFVGITEIPGPRSNATILSWAKDLGVEDIYKNDDMAWCGLSHCEVIKMAQLPMPFRSYEVLRAASWVKWGEGVGTAMFMDTLVFHRSGGHHVGFYVGESKKSYHVLGGNQSNRYGFSELAKDRCIAVRRPLYAIPPPNLRQIFIDSNGKLSTNEA